MECEWYTEERNYFVNKIENIIGVEKWEEEKGKENKGMALILGFSQNSKELMNEVKSFLGKMWNKRMSEGFVRRYEFDHNYGRRVE